MDLVSSIAFSFSIFFFYFPFYLFSLCSIFSMWARMNDDMGYMMIGHMTQREF